MNYKTDTQKGRYTLINPKKYMGDKIPVYKSKWEKKVFYAIDRNPYVLEWGYEVIPIYYHNPVYGRYTIYYPDIFCRIQNESGKKEQLLIEIKPVCMMTMPTAPTRPKNKSLNTWQNYQKRLKSYQSKVRDYSVNKAKWEAATKWCMRHDVKWLFMHENNTSGLFREGT